LLQVLDDGRLTDNKGRNVNFKNTIVIMTSNIGSQLIQQEFETINSKNKDEVIERTKDKVLEVLKQTIKPEFLNRIDEVIVFTPLFKEDIRNIVKLQFSILKNRLAKNQIQISMTEEAMDYLAEKGYDPVFGARPLKRLIQKVILNQLSKAILSGSVIPESVILIEMKNNEIFFSNAK